MGVKTNNPNFGGKMKKRVAFFLCIFFIATMTMACKGCEGGTPDPSPSPSVSPTPTPTPESYWAKAYGTTLDERCFRVIPAHDGGYIAWGSSNNYRDCLIIKLDKEGVITWQKSFGGTGFDICDEVCELDDGSLIAACQTESFGKGSRDIWILKFDKNGSLVWQITYGGSSWEDGYTMAKTSDGGFIIGGCTQSFGNGGMDFFILKFDSSGDLSWQKTYGGSNWDVCGSILQTSDGGFIAGGYTLSFGNGNYDIWITKLSSIGEIQWQKAYGGSSDDRLHSLIQTSDGSYVVGGFTKTFGNGDFDFWLFKIDSNGNIDWQETFGGTNSDILQTVRLCSDGGYIIGGESYSYGRGNADYWVLKLDSSGNIAWQYTYGGASEEIFYSIIPTSAGYIIGGYSSSFGSGGHDMWILKVDQNGKFGSDEMTSFMTATNVVPKTSNGTSWVTTATSYNASATQTTTNVTPTNPNCIVKTQFPQ